MKAKAILLFSALLASSFILNSCNQNDCTEGNPDLKCVCTLEYAPVCGCDDVTYPNPCAADCAGVSDYTPGGCN